jgi:hypothetical protein
MSSDGKLVYEVVTRATQIFEIPVGKDGREAGPPAELPLAEGLLYHSPSASRNGRWMVYVEAEYGKSNKRLVLRDLTAGTNRVLDESPFDDDVGSASIRPTDLWSFSTGPAGALAIAVRSLFLKRAASRGSFAKIAPRADSHPMAPLYSCRRMGERLRAGTGSSPLMSQRNGRESSLAIRTKACIILSFHGTTIGSCSRNS